MKESVPVKVSGGQRAPRLPAAAWALAVLVAAASLVLLVIGATKTTPADGFGLSGLGGLGFTIASLSFATTGALIATRLPANRIGWIFCLMGVLIGTGNLAYQVADVTLYVSPGSLPGGDAAAVFQNLGLTPCFGLLGLSLLLFPDGRLLSSRWRPAAGAAIAGSVLIFVAYGLRPGPLDSPFQHVRNPFGLGSFEMMDGLSGLGWMLMVLSIALAAASLIVRLRRAKGAERQQLKWIALAAAGSGVVLVGNAITFFLDARPAGALLVAVGLAFASFPVTAGFAILRYRLYDIDVVVNRTLVYGALTATLAVVYLGSVLLLQLVLSGVTEDSGLAVAASTLAVAALFRPARARIQGAVDHRFYRRKYDAARTLAGFGARARDQVDLDSLRVDLQSVVRETMQPAHVSLWLRGS